MILETQEEAPMINSIFWIKQMTLALLILTVMLVVLPAWSDSGKKLSVKGAAHKDLSVGNGDKSRRDHNDLEKDVKDGGGKAEGTVKKKIVKNAGLAAAAGVVGKKVRSKLKNNRSD